MKKNRKKDKEKKNGAHIFVFSNLFVFKCFNACTNTNITFYAYNMQQPCPKETKKLT